MTYTIHVSLNKGLNWSRLETYNDLATAKLAAGNIYGMNMGSYVEIINDDTGSIVVILEPGYTDPSGGTNPVGGGSGDNALDLIIRGANYNVKVPTDSSISLIQIVVIPIILSVVGFAIFKYSKKG